MEGVWSRAWAWALKHRCVCRANAKPTCSPLHLLPHQPTRLPLPPLPTTPPQPQVSAFAPSTDRKTRMPDELKADGMQFLRRATDAVEEDDHEQ